MENIVNLLGVDPSRIYSFFALILLLWVIVTLSALVDLWDGIYTAKKLKQRVRSHKFKSTISKLAEYWRVMLLSCFIDAVGLLFPWYSLPYFSMLLCVGIVGIEGKSIWEHIRRRKSNVAKIPETLQEIADFLGDVELKDFLIEMARKSLLQKNNITNENN